VATCTVWATCKVWAAGVALAAGAAARAPKPSAATAGTATAVMILARLNMMGPICSTSPEVPRKPSHPSMPPSTGWFRPREHGRPRRFPGPASRYIRPDAVSSTGCSGARPRPKHRRSGRSPTRPQPTRSLRCTRRTTRVHGSLKVWVDLRRQRGKGTRHPLLNKCRFARQPPWAHSVEFNEARLDSIGCRNLVAVLAPCPSAFWAPRARAQPGVRRPPPVGIAPILLSASCTS